MFNSAKFIEDCMVYNTNNPRHSMGSSIQRDGVDLATRLLATALLEYIEKLKGSKISVKLDDDVTTVKTNFISKQTTDIFFGDEPGKIEFRDGTVRVTDSNGNVIMADLSGHVKATTDTFEGNIHILSYLMDKTPENESLTVTSITSPIAIAGGEGKIVGKGDNDFVFFNKESLDTAKFSMQYPTLLPAIGRFKQYMADRYVEPDKSQRTEPGYAEGVAAVSEYDRAYIKSIYQEFGQEVISFSNKAFSENPDDVVKL